MTEKFTFQDCQFDIDTGVGESYSALMEWMNRRLINAVALPANVLQPSHYRITLQQQHDWMSLVMDIQLCVTPDRSEAIAIATELRDRYPNMSFAEIGRAIRAGRLWRDGGYFLAASAYHALSTVALINRMRTPIGEPKGIGNTNCKYNAHSEYLRCAVNPSGSCEDCGHFEERDRV